MVIAIFDAAMGITSGMILYHTVPVFKRNLKALDRYGFCGHGYGPDRVGWEGVGAGGSRRPAAGGGWFIIRGRS
jgi:hypothetical protein